jgi:hypothetical protein
MHSTPFDLKTDALSAKTHWVLYQMPGNPEAGRLNEQGKEFHINSLPQGRSGLLGLSKERMTQEHSLGHCSLILLIKRLLRLSQKEPLPVEPLVKGYFASQQAT